MQRIFLVLLLIVILKASHAADSTYVQYKGTYLFPYGSMVQTVDVELADSILVIKSNIGNSKLQKMGLDTFYLVAYDGLVVFKRDSLKMIRGIKIEAQSVLLEGEKQPDRSSGSNDRQKKFAQGMLQEQLFKRES